MKLLVSGLLLFAMGATAQTAIPAGTIIPARLNSTLNSQKISAGRSISARVMQDVALPGGKVLRAGTTVFGEILSVTPAKDSNPAEIIFQFDKVKLGGQMVPINTTLRALASMMEVADAQVPPTGPDRGTPWAWSTRDLIGGEVAYGEGGPVARGTKVVGHALADGVLVPAQGTGNCEGNTEQPQALWVFSSDACGVYGISGVRIARAQRSGPITLTGTAKFQVRSGSGMLLRVNGP